jgi:protein-disulfide isomerase
VIEGKAPPSGKLGASIAGGLIGATIMAALLLLAAPQLLSSRIVRTGIMTDPQVLIDASEALRDLQYEPLLAQHRAALEQPFASSWKGAAKPDVTIVEFFDYACPYCKASNPHIDRLVREDPGLRVVYRELPILGPESLNAARLSLAASKAGRFTRFNEALWAAGRPRPQTLAAAAAATGIAPTHAQAPDIEAELRKNFEIASALGVKGTPFFIIGHRVISDAADFEELKSAVTQARAKK